MKGPSDELKRASAKLLATRGVKHGGVELIAISPPAEAHDHAPPKKRAKQTRP